MHTQTVDMIEQDILVAEAALNRLREGGCERWRTPRATKALLLTANSLPLQTRSTRVG